MELQAALSSNRFQRILRIRSMILPVILNIGNQLKRLLKHLFRRGQLLVSLFVSRNQSLRAARVKNASKEGFGFYRP